MCELSFFPIIIFKRHSYASSTCYLFLYWKLITSFYQSSKFIINQTPRISVNSSTLNNFQPSYSISSNYSLQKMFYNFSSLLQFPVISEVLVFLFNENVSHYSVISLHLNYQEETSLTTWLKYKSMQLFLYYSTLMFFLIYFLNIFKILLLWLLNCLVYTLPTNCRVIVSVIMRVLFTLLYPESNTTPCAEHERCFL